MFRLVGKGRLVGRCDAFEAYDELVEWTKEGRLLLDQREYAAGVSREDSSRSGVVSKRSEWQCEDSGRSSSGNKSSMVRFEKANDVVCGTVGDICGRMSGRCRSKYAADEGDKGGDCGIMVGEGFASSLLRHLSFENQTSGNHVAVKHLRLRAVQTRAGGDDQFLTGGARSN